MTIDEAITGVVEKLREVAFPVDLPRFREAERILRALLPPIIEAAQREGKYEGFVAGNKFTTKGMRFYHGNVEDWPSESQAEIEGQRRYGTKGG